MQSRAHMLNIFNQITVKSYTHTIIHLYKLYYACKFTNNIMFKLIIYNEFETSVVSILYATTSFGRAVAQW